MLSLNCASDTTNNFKCYPPPPSVASKPSRWNIISVPSQNRYFSDDDNCCFNEPNSCKQIELPFRQNPEFQIRAAPAEPYPSKETLKPLAPCDETDKNSNVESESSEILPCPKWTSRFCLQTIHNILIRPELECLGERVLSIWNIYIHKSPTGLLMSETDVMANIVLQLNLKFIKLDYGYEYIELIINHLKKGLQIKRLGEALDIKRLVYSLTKFGHAICNSSCPIAQTKTLEILTDWLDLASKRQRCNKNIKRCPNSNEQKIESVKTKLVPGGTFLEALEISRLPQIITEYIQKGSYTNAYCDIILFLRRSCDASALIRTRTLTMPLLNPLLLKLCLEDCSNQILGRTVELIYSLLGQPVETADKIRSMPCPHEKLFEILLIRFFKQITQFSSKLLLNVRNDTAFVICLLAKNIPQLREKFGKHASAVASLVSSNILGVQCIQIPYIIDSTPEDAELLEYLLWMIQLITETGLAMNMIQEYHIIAVLIRILLGPSNLIEEISKISKIDSLESIALGTLIRLAKQQPKTLLQEDGVPVMLEFLKIYNNSNGQTDMKTVSMFTHLLRTILSTEDEEAMEEIIHYFNNLGALEIFIDTVKHMTIKKFSVNEEPILCNLLFCCAFMGNHDMAEKIAFTENDGVKILTRLIRQLLYLPANERHMNPVLHIAIAECVIKCIADSPSCLEMFLGYEGLLKLLDLLELSAGPAASCHILNCILELCDYPRCMDQVLYWRRSMNNLTQRLAFGDGFNLPKSKMPGAVKPMHGETLGDISGIHDHTLAAMLSELWRDEETRLGVLRDSDGCILSLDKPLMSSFARGYRKPEEKTRSPSGYPGPSCLDLTGSVRPKIYLLIKKITDTVNTEAALFDSLSLPNQLTMQIIINFLDLKRGEIWIEIMEELQEEKEKCRLVPTDEKAVELLAKISRNKAAAVIETQRYLIQRAAEHDEIHEREMYSMIQKCHLQGHLKAIREAEYIARTTDYNYLVEKRLWQKTQLENAVVKDNPNIRIHRTTDGPLNITVWPSKLKIFVSEPEVDTEGLIVIEPKDYIPLGQKKPGDTLADNSALSLSKFGIERKKDERHSLNVSLAALAEDDGDVATPSSAEPGFYQVSPSALRKALEQLLAEQIKKGWVNNVNDENFWKVRTKWRNDWYPEEETRKTNFGMSFVNV